MREKKFYRRPTLPLELLLGQPRSQVVYVLNISLRWQAWTLREPSTLALMSCWTMTSSASYSLSRSLDMQVWSLPRIAATSTWWCQLGTIGTWWTARDPATRSSCTRITVNVCAGQLADKAGWKHNRSVPWHNSQRRDQEAVHGGWRDRGAVAGGQAGGRWLEGGAQLQVPPRPSAEGDTD